MKRRLYLRYKAEIRLHDLYKVRIDNDIMKQWNNGVRSHPLPDVDEDSSTVYIYTH